MDFWTNILLFILVLFFYMHIQHQFKKSEDLEIYEMDYLSNTNLQEITALKQPVFFVLEEIQDIFSKIHMEMKEEVFVKDIRDYSVSNDVVSVDKIALSFSSAYGLMKTDTKSAFFSENNRDFILENGLQKEYAKISQKIGNPWSIHTEYDLIFGSAGVQIPWRYHTYSERFLAVSDGAGVRMKITPWKSRKYFDVVHDYENYEFWCRPSKIDSSLKTVDFDLKPGSIVYIPAYWFYTIEIIAPTTTDSMEAGSKPTSFLAGFSYITPMNLVANLPNYGRFYLQQHNTVKIDAKVFENRKSSIEIEQNEESSEKVLPLEKKEETVQEMLQVIERKESNLEKIV